MMFLYISLWRDCVARGEGSEIPQPIEVEGELKWEMERMLCYRKKCNSSTLQYLVKYLGFDLSNAI